MVQEFDSKGVRSAEDMRLCREMVAGRRGWDGVVVRLIADSVRFGPRTVKGCTGGNIRRFAGACPLEGRLQGIDSRWFERRGRAARRAFIGDLAADSGWHPDRSSHHSIKVVECQLVTE